jgi:anti-sigma B factor antagonist
MAATARIAVEDEDGVPVVRFLDRQLMDDRAVREAADQLMATLPTREPVRVILDFSNVAMISSAMLGRLVLLQRRADQSGGLLRLCEVSPSVRDVLRTTNLDRILKVARDRREAREAFGPKGS